MSTASLDGLIDRGRELLERLAGDPTDPAAAQAIRAWQQESGAAVSRLSAGRKSHWLARAYSEAFLVRDAGNRFVSGASPAEIVARVVTVLERAALSLAQANAPPSSPQGASTSRFDFVRGADLRPVLEQVYSDSRHALDTGDFGRALILSSSILEAIITDALIHRGPPDRVGDLATSSFEGRIAAAEDAGLVRGCGRLPRLARHYRDLTDPDGELAAAVVVSEREARVTAQVLHVVMRDLNPGR